MTTITIALTAHDVARCVEMGDVRNSRHAPGSTRFGQGDARAVRDDRLGVVGEFAVAKHYRLDWPSPQDLQSPDGDVGRFEVRATTRQAGRLILHDDDVPERAYILARVTRDPADGSARVVLVGYYKPWWGLRANWWEEHRQGGGCYFVPNLCLQSMPRRLAS